MNDCLEKRKLNSRNPAMGQGGKFCVKVNSERNKNR